MLYFHKVAYVQYLGAVDIVSYMSKKFLPLYNSAKIIKIYQDFPKLWSHCTATFLWFTVYSDKWHVYEQLAHNGYVKWNS